MKHKIVVLMLISFMLCGCGKEEQHEPATVENIEIEHAVDVVEEVKEEFVVCLDAGHGFGDGGCSSDLLEELEADINLSVTMMVKEELEAQGATVLLTHNGETYPSASVLKAEAERCGVEYKERIIRDNDVFSAYERSIYSIVMHREKPIHFFVSLHVNSNEEVEGMSRYELYYYEDNVDVPLLEKFGQSLAEKLDNETLVEARNRKRAYTVTCIAEYPAILIEMGYANNPDDAEKLNSVEWRKEFAKILADEIMLLRE